MGEVSQVSSRGCCSCLRDNQGNIDKRFALLIGIIFAVGVVLMAVKWREPTSDLFEMGVSLVTLSLSAAALSVSCLCKDKPYRRNGLTEYDMKHQDEWKKEREGARAALSEVASAKGNIDLEKLTEDQKEELQAREDAMPKGSIPSGDTITFAGSLVSPHYTGWANQYLDYLRTLPQRS